jgi:hypothetical protein
MHRRHERPPHRRRTAEHEEVLVEEANGVGSLTTHEQNRTLERLDLTRRVVIKPTAVERVQRPGVRRQLAQKQIFRRKPPDRREAPHGAL